MLPNDIFRRKQYYTPFDNFAWPVKALAKNLARGNYNKLEKE